MVGEECIFHFDCGDSNSGPIGFCASVQARSEADALQLLRELPSEVAIAVGNKKVLYARIYLNIDNVSSAEIDSVTPSAESIRPDFSMRAGSE